VSPALKHQATKRLPLFPNPPPPPTVNPLESKEVNPSDVVSSALAALE
jgi:hypothetical protein